MSKMEKRSGILFWGQIAAILLMGVIASAVVRGLLPKPQETQPEVWRSVTFAEQDGTILDVKEVPDGKGIFPPEYPCEGVFRGWSGRINQVTCDVEVHPVVYQIAEDNLFYFHSVYVQEGYEFNLDICLGGRVSLSRGQLTVFYDPEVLKYTGAAPADVCQVSEGEAGKLILMFDSESPIREETVLAQLTFQALEKDVYTTEIQLRASNVELVTNGQTIPADVATINNKIFFLQEVG